MDAFSALTANLVQTAPAPPTTTPSPSPSANENFATHLQSATKQQQTGQRAPAKKAATAAEAEQTPPGQANDASTDQTAGSQVKKQADKPVQAGVEQKDNAAQDRTAVETIAAAQSALPAAALPREATGKTAAVSSPSAMARMLDAITMNAPAGNNPQQTIKSAEVTVDGPATEAIAGTGMQQIAVESVVPATTSSISQPLAGLPEPPVTVASLLQTATGEQNGGTAPVPAMAVQTAATVAGENTVIMPSSSPPPVTDDPTAPLVVQNQYAQIITIQQTSALPAVPESQGTLPAALTTGSSAVDMDLTNQYIHSHLPNETATKGENTAEHSGTNTESEQSASSNQTPQQNESQGTVEPLLAAKSLTSATQESQPLLFSHQQGNGLTSSSLTPSTTQATATNSALYRLPSGATVPEGTVIDQMITHFSINRQLESSSVNLKLYPQELGELRMEIKVEQDNVKAHIITQSPHAQEMIDRHLPKLREALAQQGLHLGQVEVTVASNDNAAGERFQEQTTRQQNHRTIGAKQNQASFELDLDDELIVTSSTVDNNLSVIA